MYRIMWGIITGVINWDTRSFRLWLKVVNLASGATLTAARIATSCILGNRVFQSPRYDPVRASHLRTGGVQRACNAAGGDITLKRRPLRTVLKTWHVKETILVTI